MRPTLRDVAAKANVSFQLVSAVLSDKSYARASEETRERIKNAAKELGYVVNVNASRLRSGKSKIIGVLMDSDAPYSVRMLVTELEKSFSSRNYNLMTAEAHNAPESLYRSFLSLKKNSVEAVILLALDYPETDLQLKDVITDQNSIITVNGKSNPQHPHIDDNIEQGIELAVDHLKKSGCRNIALLCADTQVMHYSISRRINGFKAVEKDGKVIMIDLGESGQPGTMSGDIRKVISEHIIPDNIDGVIASNDYVAAILEKELMSIGKKIPEDVAIIGFDDLPVCQCMPTTLSSITFNRSLIAETAADTVMSMLKNKKYPQRQSISAKLIIRNSTLKNKENNK